MEMLPSEFLEFASDYVEVWENLTAETLYDHEYGEGLVTAVRINHQFINASFLHTNQAPRVVKKMYKIPEDFSTDIFKITIERPESLRLFSFFQKKGKETSEAENHALREQIKCFCSERGIDNLIHFTRLENMEKILNKGLLSRKDLELWNKESLPIFNDEKRLDGWKNAICLSISFPNYKMFYKYRDKKPEKWAVILLKPDILWELDCAFFNDNAARTEEKLKPLPERKKLCCLRSMFEDHPKVQRACLGIPNSFTTSPQAEVLVFDVISASYISEIHIEKDDHFKELTYQNEESFKSKFTHKCDGQFFCPRMDWRYWQKNSQEKELETPLDLSDGLDLSLNKKDFDGDIPF